MTWYNICTYIEADFRMAKQHDKQFKLDAIQYYEDHKEFGLRGCRPSPMIICSRELKKKSAARLAWQFLWKVPELFLKPCLKPLLELSTSMWIVILNSIMTTK